MSLLGPLELPSQGIDLILELLVLLCQLVPITLELFL